MTIGLLLPEGYTPRYEKFDRPLIERRSRICGETAGRSTATPRGTQPPSSR